MIPTPEELNIQTEVRQSHSEIPRQFLLYQNYPNPFNPSATIEFSVSHTSHVFLTVLNVLGQEIATLVSEPLHAGTFNSEWSASGFSSGTYYYAFKRTVLSKRNRFILFK